MIAGGGHQIKHIWAQMMAGQQSFTQLPPVSAGLAGRVTSGCLPGCPRRARPAQSSPSLLHGTHIHSDAIGQQE